jgi:hypothetical protein
MNPRPPPSDTAAASAAPATNAIGALRIGCSIPSRSQSLVRTGRQQLAVPTLGRADDQVDDQEVR